ncbi:hypothetical protein CRG98_003768 [Punica granatum]|uniref:Uncharacterized protein n=1 Tax=Punica granatum TaxID=22663 RepID=A0A2I0L5F9_PUNGR|nr:hypothetical protein CRG98_003768 [Punica granatum]
MFESQATRLNAWKDARMQRMHARARMGARESATGRCARGRAGLCSDEDECELSILHMEKPRALMSINEGLSVVFKLLGYFQPRVQEKLGMDGLAREELPLGNSWVPRPKRRNREKARVSIDRAFEACGSN